MTTPTERDASGRFIKNETDSAEVNHGADDMHPVSKILFGWVENKRTPLALLVVIIVVCVSLFAVDVFHHRPEYLHFAEATGFYALWGFGAFALAVLSGWPLGKLLRRSEDYYGEADTVPNDVEDKQ
ncbi:MAG: hypothetical protein ABNH53_03235 [Henriciella sp.]|jgi:hypothetical protein